MTTPIRCRLLRNSAEIDAIAADWGRLWRARPIRHVFQGPAWHLALLDSHGAERNPCVVVAEAGEDVVGLLPLSIEAGRLGFLGAPYGDYNDLLGAEARAGETLAAMIAALDAAGLGELVLENVRQDALLRDAASRVPSDIASRLHWSEAALCPAVALGSEGEAVVAAILRKQSLRRHQKKLGRRGSVSFRHLATLEEARTLLPLFFDQHVARREAAGDVSLFRRPTARRFYEALLRRLALETIRFSVLELEGAPAAFHFGFEYDRRLIWYKASFAVELRDCGPGEVLLAKLFEYARDRGLVELDFTRGAEPFKARFANTTRRNYTLRVVPTGVAGALLGFGLTAKRALKRLGRGSSQKPRVALN